MNKKLIINQLSQKLKVFESLKNTPRPPKGWIRAIRTALGINNRQFSNLLNVHKSRISKIEQDEINDALTIKTMRNVAEALDCEFVYGFAPKTTLSKTIEKRAREVVQKTINKTNYTMRLEKQSLSKEELNEVLEEKVKKLIETMPKTLWDNDNEI